MLTREEILSGFKKVDFPDKLLDESIKNAKKILFFEESTQPASQKEKDTKKLSQSYVLPWRLVQKNYPESVNNKNNTFSRGSNFIPKEPLVNIKIDNFKLIFDKYSLPLETGLIYFKNNYGVTNGPYNLEQIKNLQKNKKLDSTYEFRPIDIFCFKDSELFSFPFQNNNKEEAKEEKPSEIKKEEIKPKIEDIPLEDKKQDNKKDKKEDIKEDKQLNQTKKETEGKWEVVGKKKKTNKEKEEEETNQIIGLKTKDSKEGNKKGKKKKKGQFEDTNFELGFKIK